MKIKNIKKLVINIDMVVGFCEKGNMADIGIKRTIPYQIERLEQAKKEEGTQIVFIGEGHTKDSVEFNDFPEHCIIGTIEADFVDELKEYADDENTIVFRKNSTSGITNQFMEYVDKLENLEEVEIQGCCTDICVMNFAIPVKNRFNEQNKNIDVVIYEETVETYDAPNHNRQQYNEMAFKFMRLNGIKVKKIGGR